MDNQPKKGSSGGVVFIIIVVIVLAIAIGSCGSGGGSSSGKKWSDLSKTEQDNARWAYEAREYINSKGN